MLGQVPQHPPPVRVLIAAVVLCLQVWGCFAGKDAQEVRRRLLEGAAEVLTSEDAKALVGEWAPESKQYVTFSPFLSAADLIEQRANADALDLEKAFSAGRNAEGLSRRFNNTRIIIGYVEPTSGILFGAVAVWDSGYIKGANKIMGYASKTADGVTFTGNVLYTDNERIVPISGLLSPEGILRLQLTSLPEEPDDSSYSFPDPIFADYYPSAAMAKTNRSVSDALWDVVQWLNNS